MLVSVQGDMNEAELCFLKWRKKSAVDLGRCCFFEVTPYVYRAFDETWKDYMSPHWL